MTVGGLASLSIEDSGNDCVGIMRCQTTEQSDRIFIRADGRLTTRQIDRDVSESATTPTQRNDSAILILVNRDDDLFEDGAQELFAVIAASTPSGSGAVSTACATASSTCSAPIVRQSTPRPFTILLPAQ